MDDSDEERMLDAGVYWLTSISVDWWLCLCKYGNFQTLRFLICISGWSSRSPPGHVIQ